MSVRHQRTYLITGDCIPNPINAEEASLSALQSKLLNTVKEHEEEKKKFAQNHGEIKVVQLPLWIKNP